MILIPDYDLSDSTGNVQRADLRNGIVGAELDIVVRLHGYDVWEQVATRKSEVLDDEVETFVGILNARDWDVSDLKTRDIRVERMSYHTPRTCLMMLGRMTFRMSIQSSGLNFRLPSLSNRRSLVRRAQSSPNLLLSGSSPIARNQSPVVEKRLSKWALYLTS